MKQYWLIHSQLYSASSKNGFPLHHTTCYMCPPSKNDWDCRQGLNSPQSWGWSLWANDSSRDTQCSETDCQGTSDGPNNPPGTSLPDPAMTHQVETTKGKTGAAKEGRAENAGIWVKGHVEERTQLYVPTQFRRYTWWDIWADQEWTIGQLGYNQLLQQSTPLPQYDIEDAIPTPCDSSCGTVTIGQKWDAIHRGLKSYVSMSFSPP